MELESQADTRLGSGSKHDKASKHDGIGTGEAKGVIATVAGRSMFLFSRPSQIQTTETTRGIA